MADDLVPDCPDCRAPMRVRERARDGHRFFGCTKYPECCGTRTFDDGEDWILRNVIGECEVDQIDTDMRWDQ